MNTAIHQCNYCDHAQTRNKSIDHVIEVHNDQVGDLVRKFQDHNSESIKLLENVPESEYIFTPDEITHFSVDWKIHLEILKTMAQLQKNIQTH